MSPTTYSPSIVRWHWIGTIVKGFVHDHDVGIGRHQDLVLHLDGVFARLHLQYQELPPVISVLRTYLSVYIEMQMEMPIMRCQVVIVREVRLTCSLHAHSHSYLNLQARA
ncbi:hypothetical protein ACN47E_001280 [Coniothyrium glycines]